MWVAVAATVVSAVVSTVGAIKQGQAAKQAADYNAEVAQQNAQLAAQNTASQVAVDQEQSQENALANTRKLAALRAAYGSSGLELSGSNLDALQDTSNQLALNNSQVDFQQQIDKRNGAVQVLQLQDQASLDVAQGQNAQTASQLTAVGSAAKGAGTLAQLSMDNSGGT